MAAKTKAALKAQTDSNVTSNSNRENTGARVRELLNDLIDSLGNPLDVNTFAKTQTIGAQNLAHNTAWDARDGGLLLLTVNGSDVTLLAPSDLPANTTFLLVITYTTVNPVLLPSVIKGVSGLTFEPTVGQKEALMLLSDETGTNLQCVAYEPDIAGS